MEKVSGYKLLCLKQNLFRPYAQVQRWGGRARAASWQTRLPKTSCAASSDDELKAAMQDPKVGSSCEVALSCFSRWVLRARQGPCGLSCFHIQLRPSL